MPSRAEIEALYTGRLTKRHVVMLPGSIPIVMNLRSSTVVQDVILEVTRQMDRIDPLEVEEFALFIKAECEEQLLRKEEYVFDLSLTFENGDGSYLLFKRLTWILPTRG